MQTLINIDVPDLDAAIDFYQRATGLKLVRRLFDGSVAELAGASTRIISSFAWGRQATLSDPFGHGFCLLQWRGGGYDEVA